MKDVIIIGAGPAGLAAALWCDELYLDTLLLEEKEEIGGQLLWTHNRIENHLGATAQNGRDLRDLFALQTEERGFNLWTGAQIDSVDLKSKRVWLKNGDDIQAIAIIIATGVRRRRLGVPGEEELKGRGVIESGKRDRHLVVGQDVCVVGGGDAAAENALILSEVCPTVTLVHRGKTLRARREFVEKIKATHNITIFTETTLLRIIGESEVEGVEIVRKGAFKPLQIAVRGVLIRVGIEPNSEPFAEQLNLDENGYVKINSSCETEIQNVFAIGDVANPIAPTISGAIGMGATAAKVIAARLNG